MIGNLSFAGHVVCAAGLGAAIGLERQWRQRMAGLRTNALVAAGSALFVALTLFTKLSDPTRVAAQVVSGIGFLGAGVILRDGVNIRGINTAATIWCSAAVGVLAGFGFYLPALMGAAVVVTINLFLRPIARKIDRSPVSADSEVQTMYELRAVSRADDEAHMRALLLQCLAGGGFSLQALQSADVEDGSRVEVQAEVAHPGRDERRLEDAVSRLSLEPGVSAVRWRVIGNEESPAPWADGGIPAVSHRRLRPGGRWRSGRGTQSDGGHSPSEHDGS